MIKKSIYPTLIELAEAESEKIALELSKAMKVVSNSKQKYSTLILYRDDYSVKLDEKMKSGISMQTMANFQGFITKLDSAIAMQECDVQKSTLHEERIRSLWIESEKKRLSYLTLLEKENLRALLTASRADQKSTDEFASRNFYKMIEENNENL